MTTAFQTVFDNAEQLSFNRRRKVATTTSRSGVVKATSIGGQVWEFEVLLPSGPAWTDYRPLIERMEALDRVTVGQVQINKAGQEWITGYRGDLTHITAVTVSYSSGNTVTITGGATLGSGFRFRSGDVIQLGTSGAVYSVVNDVAFNATTVTLHRPVREAAGSYTLRVGPNVVWNVLCVSFPKWNLFSRDQVGWDGPFVFVEAV
jgi:Cu/Ag efflux pump CusA